MKELDLVELRFQGFIQEWRPMRDYICGFVSAKKFFNN
jgi:hypothetical protein